MASHEDGDHRWSDLLSVQGLSELVRGTRATFLDSLDEIEVFDPARLRFPLPTGN
jgi:hypothetical protein